MSEEGGGEAPAAPEPTPAPTPATAPRGARPPGSSRRVWRSGLCNCFAGKGGCLDCVACFLCVAPYTLHAAANVSGRRFAPMALLLGCPCTGICTATSLRGKYRDANGIDGGCVGDCCAVWCCAPCAFMQMQADLENEPGAVPASVPSSKRAGPMTAPAGAKII